MKIQELIGNENIKTQLIMAAAASIKRNDAIPHIVFEGPPGTGKTLFSKSLAETVNTLLFQEEPTSINNSFSVKKITDKFPTQGYDSEGNITGKILPPIVFIDEIHSVPIKGQEALGIAMENWAVQGESVPRFTVIGATTLVGNLSKPFLDRFKLCLKFKPYNIIDSTMDKISEKNSIM